MSTGVLTIQATYGRLTHNTQSFSEMDPYVKFRLGDQKGKSEVARNMHLNPRWSTQIIFQYRNETHMEVEVWNKGILKDSLIGKGTINLAKWSNKANTKFTEWIPLIYKHKQAGAILVEINYERDRTNEVSETLAKDVIPTTSNASIVRTENRNMDMSSPYTGISLAESDQKQYSYQSSINQPTIDNSQNILQSSNLAYSTNLNSLRDYTEMYKSEALRRQPDVYQNPVYEERITAQIQPEQINKPLSQYGRSLHVVDTSYYSDLSGKNYLTEQIPSEKFQRRPNFTQSDQIQPIPKMEPTKAIEIPLETSKQIQSISPTPVLENKITPSPQSNVAVSTNLNKQVKRYHNEEIHGPRLGMIFDD